MDPGSNTFIALIAAGSAIAGAVISQVVSIARDYLGRKNRRYILLRNKYEELANHITENEAWAIQLSAAKTFLITTMAKH